MLARFRRAVVQPILTAARTHNDWDLAARSRALHVLRAIGWRPQTAAERALVAAVELDWDSLATLGPAAVPYLIDIIADERYYADRAATLLIRIGHPCAIALLASTARSRPNQAEIIIRTFEILLRNIAISVETSDLLTVVNLARVRQSHYDEDGEYIGTREVDCSELRQLARKELVRRGVNW